MIGLANISQKTSNERKRSVDKLNVASNFHWFVNSSIENYYFFNLKKLISLLFSSSVSEIAKGKKPDESSAAQGVFKFIRIAYGCATSVKIPRFSM